MGAVVLGTARVALLHAGLESFSSGSRAPRAVLRPRCFVPRPGAAENCWGERGCEFPSPPPPSLARPHADRPTAHRVAVEPVRPSRGPCAPPFWVYAWEAVHLSCPGAQAQLGLGDALQRWRTIDAREACRAARRQRWSTPGLWVCLTVSQPWFAVLLDLRFADSFAQSTIGGGSQPFRRYGDWTVAVEPTRLSPKLEE